MCCNACVAMGFVASSVALVVCTLLPPVDDPMMLLIVVHFMLSILVGETYGDGEEIDSGGFSPDSAKVVSLAILLSFAFGTTKVHDGMSFVFLGADVAFLSWHMATSSADAIMAMQLVVSLAMITQDNTFLTAYGSDAVDATSPGGAPAKKK